MPDEFIVVCLTALRVYNRAGQDQIFVLNIRVCGRPGNRRTKWGEERGLGGKVGADLIECDGR